MKSLKARGHKTGTSFFFRRGISQKIRPPKTTTTTPTTQDDFNDDGLITMIMEMRRKWVHGRPDKIRLRCRLAEAKLDPGTRGESERKAKRKRSRRWGFMAVSLSFFYVRTKNLRGRVQWIFSGLSFEKRLRIKGSLFN